MSRHRLVVFTAMWIIGLWASSTTARITPITDTACFPPASVSSLQYLVAYEPMLFEEGKRLMSISNSQFIPVRITGFRRAFNTPSIGLPYWRTILGVVPAEAAAFNAVIFQLPLLPKTDAAAVKLARVFAFLDSLEVHYCRRLLPVSSLAALADQHRIEPDAQHWIYLSQTTEDGNEHRPSPEYRVSLRYVDDFISGCLVVEVLHDLAQTQFAESCVIETSGWNCWWVNDRILQTRPQQQRVHVIDALLNKYVPEAFNAMRCERQRCYAHHSDKSHSPELQVLQKGPQSELFGQCAAQETVITAPYAHFKESNLNTGMAVVLRFHGGPGTGNTTLADPITESLHVYRNRTTKGICYCFCWSGQQFRDESKVNDCQEVLQTEMNRGVNSIPCGLFVFDEPDKAPPGLFDVIVQFIEYQHIIKNTADHQRAIYVFRSNSWSIAIKVITRAGSKAWRCRQDMIIMAMEEGLLNQVCSHSAAENWLYGCRLIHSKIINYFVPCLTLERHVIQCTDAQLKRCGTNTKDADGICITSFIPWLRLGVCRLWTCPTLRNMTILCARNVLNSEL